jgi:hypothetical protein
MNSQLAIGNCNLMWNEYSAHLGVCFVCLFLGYVWFYSQLYFLITVFV